MIDYRPLYQALTSAGAEDWARMIPAQLDRAFACESHGDLARWQQVVDELPKLSPSGVDLTDAVRIGCEADLSDLDRQALREQLQRLHPWRKGPYSLFGIDIDAEWRSDWKWSA